MENSSQTIEKLLITQTETLNNLNRLNSKLAELSKALERVDLLLEAEKNIDQILEKLKKIDTISKGLGEVNAKMPEVVTMKSQLKTNEQKIASLETETKQISKQLTSVRKSLMKPAKVETK